MIEFLTTKIPSGKYRLFLIKGDDLQLRDDAVAVFGSIAKVIDAKTTPTSDVVGIISSKGIGERKGVIKVVNGECLKLDDGFDIWLHSKYHIQTVVIVISPKEKLLAHYSRVIGRRGLIISCTLPVGTAVDVKRWVRNKAARSRVSLPLSVVADLVTRCEDLKSISNEIQKIRYGWAGRSITTEALDALIMEKSGPDLVINQLFNGDILCVKSALRVISWGTAPQFLVKMLIASVVTRIRLKEAGSTGKQAAQNLGFDPRRAVIWYDQASNIGIDNLWVAVQELSSLLIDELLIEVRLIQWLRKSVDQYKMKRRKI